MLGKVEPKKEEPRCSGALVVRGTSDEIGRRSGLENRGLAAYGFESRLVHRSHHHFQPALAGAASGALIRRNGVQVG